MTDHPDAPPATRPQEWYPNECEFCTRAAALACTDPQCRARRAGEAEETR